MRESGPQSDLARMLNKRGEQQPRPRQQWGNALSFCATPHNTSAVLDLRGAGSHHTYVVHQKVISSHPTPCVDLRGIPLTS